MKDFKTILFALAILLSSYQLAYAVDTTQTYQSGIMAALFLGVCALIVAFQTLPAVMMVAGTTIAFVKEAKKTKVKAKV